jgi:tetratricopeptide (TPR) repeat protein
MRSLMFRIIFMIGIISLAAPILVALENAQPTTQSGQISGQVRVEGNQPAFNILVNCDKTDSGTCGQQTTDRSGRFRFAGLQLSQYVITVRAPGYIEQRQEVELSSTPSAYLQFQLKSDGTPKPGTSYPIVVSANVPASAKKEYEQGAAALATGKKEGLTEGVRHLEKAISIYPQFVQANLMLGTAYMDLGELDKAEQKLKHTIELDPKAANALMALGELYLRQKKEDDAEKILLQGLQVEDRSYQGHLTLARVYWSMALKIKDDTQSQPVFEKSYIQVNKAIEINPDFAAAHLFKGNLYIHARRAADAQHEFEEYIRLEPKGASADQARATIEKIKKALESQTKHP